MSHRRLVPRSDRLISGLLQHLVYPTHLGVGLKHPGSLSTDPVEHVVVLLGDQTDLGTGRHLDLAREVPGDALMIHLNSTDDAFAAESGRLDDE